MITELFCVRRIRLFTLGAPVEAAYLKTGNVVLLIKSAPVASCTQWDTLATSVRDTQCVWVPINSRLDLHLCFCFFLFFSFLALTLVDASSAQHYFGRLTSWFIYCKWPGLPPGEGIVATGLYCWLQLRTSENSFSFETIILFTVSRVDFQSVWWFGVGNRTILPLFWKSVGHNLQCRMKKKLHFREKLPTLLRCPSGWRFIKITMCFKHMSKIAEAGSQWMLRLNYAEVFSVKQGKKSLRLWLDRMQICAFPSGVRGKVIKQRTLCLQNAFWAISSQDKKTICQEETFHLLLSVLTSFSFLFSFSNSIVLPDIFLKSFPVQPGELKDKLFIINEEDRGLSDEHITSLRRYELVPKKKLLICIHSFTESLLTLGSGWLFVPGSMRGRCVFFIGK